VTRIRYLVSINDPLIPPLDLHQAAFEFRLSYIFALIKTVSKLASDKSASVLLKNRVKLHLVHATLTGKIKAFCTNKMPSTNPTKLSKNRLRKRTCRLRGEAILVTG
jgi:hypothetical protein